MKVSLDRVVRMPEKGIQPWKSSKARFRHVIASPPQRASARCARRIHDIDPEHSSGQKSATALTDTASRP